MDGKVSPVYLIFLMTVMETICHLIGAIFLFIGIYAVSDNFSSFNKVFIILFFFLSKESATSFFLGIIFSSIFPYINFYLTYAAIIQVIFTYFGLQYYKTLKEQAK